MKSKMAALTTIALLISAPVISSTIYHDHATILLETAELKFNEAYLDANEPSEFRKRVELLESARIDILKIRILFPFTTEAIEFLRDGRSGSIEPKLLSSQIDLEKDNLRCAEDEFKCFPERAASLAMALPPERTSSRAQDIRGLPADIEYLRSGAGVPWTNAERLDEAKAMLSKDYDGIFNRVIAVDGYINLWAPTLLMEAGRDNQAKIIYGKLREGMEPYKANRAHDILELEGKYFGDQFDDILFSGIDSVKNIEKWQYEIKFEKLVKILVLLKQYGSLETQKSVFHSEYKTLYAYAFHSPDQLNWEGGSYDLAGHLTTMACMAHLEEMPEKRNAILRVLNEQTLTTANVVDFLYLPAHLLSICGASDISNAFLDDFLLQLDTVDRDDLPFVSAVLHAYELKGDRVSMIGFMNSVIDDFDPSRDDTWDIMNELLTTYGALSMNVTIDEFQHLISYPEWHPSKEMLKFMEEN